jgi:UDP-3-O-[3-hydroxymyristoyl] glucosamine N-acyltransferase
VGFVVTIGTDMQARNRLFETALRARLKPVNIIHQSAIVDKTAKIGQGVVISAGCIIGVFTQVKDNVLIFAGTILEHDCHI